jgi:hypothetical protein
LTATLAMAAGVAVDSAHGQARQDASLADELLRMAKIDRAVRALWSQKGAVDPKVAEIVDVVDRAHTARLKRIVAVHGWPTVSLVGADASAAAWLLVQHADHDVSFQKACLALLAPLAAAGEVDKSHVAYLLDRVRVAERTPQRYGTQGSCDESGRWEPFDIEEPHDLDQRRASAGMPTMAEYRALVGQFCKAPADR